MTKPISTMDFSCPTCSLALKVTPEMAGRDARCPDCRSVFTLPLEIAAKPAEDTKSFAVVCPACQARLKAGPEHVGAGTMCPRCETLLMISLPSGGAEGTATTAPPSENFVVTCPSCSKRMWARPESQGKPSRCPGCETPFVIPFASPSPDLSGQSLPESQATESPKPQEEPFQIVCPHCQASLEAGSEDLGLEAPCPACGNLFIIQASEFVPAG